VLPQSPMSSRLKRASTGSPWPHRVLSLVQGALLLVIVLCAVAHGATDGDHGPAPAAAVASTATEGGTEPHSPHHPHGAEKCASEAAVRTTAQASEQPSAPADGPAEVAAVALFLGHPFARRTACRRRRIRTGREALTRTSRWRI
jgi:hypothetical protein